MARTSISDWLTQLLLHAVVDFTRVPDSNSKLLNQNVKNYLLHFVGVLCRFTLRQRAHHALGFARKHRLANMKLVRAARWRDFWLPRIVTWKRSISAAGVNLRLASEVSRALSQGNGESPDLIPSKTEKTANYRMHDPPSKRSYVFWTSEDIRIFKEAADAGKSATEVVKLLPGRSIHGIENKLRLYRSIGDAEFSSASTQRWTLDERATILKLRQAGVTLREMLPYFPNRSRNSIHAKCLQLDSATAEGPPRPVCMRYSTVEDELLRSLAARSVPHRLCAKLLNRSRTSISSRCKKIGVLSNFFWNQAKTARLSQLSKDRLSSREIGMQLGKTPTSISKYTRRWNREVEAPNTIVKPAIGLVRLTQEHMQTIVNLREQGRTWNDIRAQEFPNIKTHTLLCAYQRLGGPTCASGGIEPKPTLSSKMSSAVFEHIQRLRDQGRTWPEIGKTTFPDVHHTSISKEFRRRLASASSGQSKDEFKGE